MTRKELHDYLKALITHLNISIEEFPDYYSEWHEGYLAGLRLVFNEILLLDLGEKDK